MDVFAALPTAALALLLVTGSGQAPPTRTPAEPQYTQWGSVQELEGGWTLDAMAVRHSAPLVNPDRCSVTNAGYATNPADAGHSLFHTLLLSAFLNRKEVSLLVSGCAFDKPRVVAVKIH
jgi:hypothetical protein